MWAACSQEGTRPPGHLQFCRRVRDGPQIVSLQGSGSSTETAMKGHYFSWRNHLRSTVQHVFGPLLLYRSYVWYGGPTLLERTPAEDELRIDKPFSDLRGLSFDISFNKSE